MLKRYIFDEPEVRTASLESTSTSISRSLGLPISISRVPGKIALRFLKRPQDFAIDRGPDLEAIFAGMVRPKCSSQRCLHLF